MPETICDTIETLLASVDEQVDDSELSYKISTARQLNIVCKEQVETYTETLEEADLDPEMVDRLEELGYL